MLRLTYSNDRFKSFTNKARLFSELNFSNSSVCVMKSRVRRNNINSAIQKIGLLRPNSNIDGRKHWQP